MVERTGKRNQCYSRRHRTWGHNYMIDVDSVEHDGDGGPLALIETKYGLIQTVDLNELRFTVLCNLANDVLPVFCTVYYPLNSNGDLVNAGYENEMEFIQFYTIPVNEVARRYLAKPKRMTELEYVDLLHKIHGTARNGSSTYGINNEWVDVVIPTVITRLP